MKPKDMFWRRGWDSNPRARFWQARRFRGAPVMTTSVPLREHSAGQIAAHLSGATVT
jgi:hypothetical protein